MNNAVIEAGAPVHVITAVTVPGVLMVITTLFALVAEAVSVPCAKIVTD